MAESGENPKKSINDPKSIDDDPHSTQRNVARETGVKEKKGKKEKLSKADISFSQDYKGVGHIGWDLTKGVNMDEVDPALKDLFTQAGISEAMLRDKETAQFIHDFIEKRGGIDAIKKLQERLPPAPSSHDGSTLPPPPLRTRRETPPLSPTSKKSIDNDPHSTQRNVAREMGAKKKKGKKGKLSKADIGFSQNYKHVGHVGWDPNKAVDMNEVDPALKDLFRAAGIIDAQPPPSNCSAFSSPPPYNRRVVPPPPSSNRRSVPQSPPSNRSVIPPLLPLKRSVVPPPPPSNRSVVSPPSPSKRSVVSPLPPPSGRSEIPPSFPPSQSDVLAPPILDQKKDSTSSPPNQSIVPPLSLSQRGTSAPLLHQEASNNQTYASGPHVPTSQRKSDSSPLPLHLTEFPSSDPKLTGTETFMQDDLILEGSSTDLVPMKTQQMSSFPDLTGKFGELALAGGAVGPAVTGPVENTIAGGEFYNANLGPVTHHNKFNQEANWTQIGTQNVVHHHHYDSDRPDEPTSPRDQEKQEAMKDVIMLTDTIKAFKSQKLHSTKLIYKGEKSTVEEPMPVVIKLMTYSKEGLREAKCLHSLDFHPNVVRIYDSGMYNTNIKFIFIAMEVCSQETLLSYVTKNKDFNPHQALNHSAQIISGLEYIHSKNISHRDLKPDNILFSHTGGYDQVKITDFGVSKNFLTDPQQTTNAFGTQGYMSPEIIKGDKSQDPAKSDIFALGLVLSFILSNGKHPYGDQPWQWNFNIANGNKPDLSQFLLPNANQRDATISIISKMLEHNPNDRPNASDALKIWLEEVGEDLRQ